MSDQISNEKHVKHINTLIINKLFKVIKMTKGIKNKLNLIMKLFVILCTQKTTYFNENRAEDVAVSKFNEMDIYFYKHGDKEDIMLYNYVKKKIMQLFEDNKKKIDF
jgi:hypothetical protein